MQKSLPALFVLAVSALLLANSFACAQASDSALLATFCDAGNIKGDTCSRAKGYPNDGERGCDVKLTEGRYTGRFVVSGNPLLVVDYESRCEPHANDFGGAVVFEQSDDKYNFVGFQPGSRVNDCITVPRNERQDSLICLAGHMGQGYLESAVAQMTFERDDGKGISISYGFLLTAADSIGAYGSNVVTCKEAPPKYFAMSKIAAGPRKETVAFEATYADADTIKIACGKGFPKPKELFGTLSNGDAYVPPGYEKKGRIIIDLVTRKVIPPG